MEALPRSTTPSVPTTAATPAVSFDAYPPPLPKLRLMCSYGGRIIPRPHDKTLCYAGGDTRIILIDRHITLSDLRLRLSKSLLQNHPFLLKYQLPNEDLDSLISLATDEDLEIMVDEHDRLTNSVGVPRRHRLFLFPKSEDWVFNRKADSAGRGRGLDDGFVGKSTAEIINKDVDSVLDSLMLETSSSHGSTSTSSSNSPPIRVRVGVDGLPPVVVGEYANRAIPDDDDRISDCGKVQQIQPRVHQNRTSAFDLPPPNSVSSAGCARQSIIHQEPLVDQCHRRLHQPQPFIHVGNQYISPGSVPIFLLCYSIYPPQNTILGHHHLPVYFVPNTHTQAYNLPSNIPSSKPEMAPQFIQVHMLPSNLAQPYVGNTQINQSNLAQPYAGNTQINQPSSNPTYNYGHNVYYNPLPPTQYQAESFRTSQPI